MYETPDELKYWRSFRKALAECTNNFSRNGQYSYNHLHRLQRTMISCSAEVTNAQAAEIEHLRKLLKKERETKVRSSQHHGERFSKLEADFHAERVARMAAEEAGKKLSVDLHETMQALNGSNKLYQEKMLEFDKSIRSYEVEIENLEEERDEALREVSSLKTKLEQSASQHIYHNTSNISQLESQLAATRLQLALAQSERDEYEIAVEYGSNSKCTAGKRSPHNQSPSSISSNNSSINQSDGGSWYRVDTTYK